MICEASSITSIVEAACRNLGIDLDTLRSIRPTHRGDRDPRFGAVCTASMAAGVSKYRLGDLIGCHHSVIECTVRRWTERELARAMRAENDQIGMQPGRPLYDDGEDG